MGCGTSQDAHDVPRQTHNKNNAPYPQSNLNNAGPYPTTPGMAYPGQGTIYPGQSQQHYPGQSQQPYPGHSQHYPGQSQPYPAYSQNHGNMTAQVHSQHTVVKVKRKKKKKKNMGNTGAAIVGGMAMGVMVGGMMRSGSMSSIFSGSSAFSFD